jgi:hypothetical protein
MIWKFEAPISTPPYWVAIDNSMANRLTDNQRRAPVEHGREPDSGMA